VACAQAPAGLPRSAPGRGDPASGSYLQAIERDPGRLTVGLSTGIWGRATRTDPEVAERVRAVAKLLDGLGHYIEEIANQSICDWQALWSAYYVNWVGGRAQFAATAKERGRGPERLQDYLDAMTYRHYLAAERHDKFDIWKMMGYANTVTCQFGRLMERFDVLLVPTMTIRVPEANGPYSLLREEELEPWLAPPRRCVPLHDAGERNRSARDLGAGRARWRRVADRRPALRQFLPRGRVATARRAGRTGTSRIVRGRSADARQPVTSNTAVNSRSRPPVSACGRYCAVPSASPRVRPRRGSPRRCHPGCR